MMTRKDFERIAQVFRVNVPHSATEAGYWVTGVTERWYDMLDDMCVEFKAMNPRFNEARFRAACEKGQ